MTFREDLRQAASWSDAAFAQYVSGHAFPGHLTAASRFANQHGSALILMPRSHAKTTLFVHRVARLVGATQGRVRLGIMTATQEDAEARSGAVRKLVESRTFAEVFPWARGGVQGSDWTNAHWSIRGTEVLHGKDYTCRADGLLSVRAGPRLDVLLADDMVGLQENATATMRAKAANIYWSVVDPMVVPDSPALRQAMADNPGIHFPVGADGSVAGRRWFLGTRWHEDDIYAELIRKGWPSLVRAALTDGVALWPDYWTAEKLAAKRLDLGSAVFDLQYQNDPAGMGGNIFKREWFRYVDSLPGDVGRRVGVDLASSTSERSDYTAVGEVAEDREGNLYICGSYAERLDEGHRQWLTGMRDGKPDTGSFGESPRLLWPLGILPPGFAGASGHPEAPRSLTSLNIEAVAHQNTFVKEVLSQTRLPATAVYPDKDKVTRARTLAARYEAGKVFHLRGGPGMDAYEHEAVAFPNAEHDDRVDAMVYAADLNSGSEFYFTSGRR